MKRKSTPQLKRRVRQERVRASVTGTLERPRLNVFRSLASMYVQLIDDVSGKTLAGVSGKKVNVDKYQVGERKGKTALAYALGMALAEEAKAKNIARVVFDRAGYKYHGRVRAIAEGARDGGLVF